jgi:penicillin-binding protein 1A
MKYVALTISIFIAAIIIVVGIICYSTYALWLNDRDEIIQRLYDLKELLERSETTVSLQPDLRQGASTVILDRRGEVVGVFAQGRRTLLPLRETPPLLIKTLLLMEDRRFYSHRGLDPRGIAAAMLENIRNLSFVRGGSTISQQLAKVLFTDARRTVQRKIYELLCTLEIEKRFTKDEILSLYLNSIFFGHHTYGIENAARFYFNKRVMDLSLYETALLVGLIPGPNRYSPLVYPQRCKRRQKIVLNTLYQHDLLSAEDQEERFDRFWKRFDRIVHRPTVSFWSMERNEAPYFVEYIRQYLVGRLGEDTVRHGGLRVYSTLDLEKQHLAEQVLWDGLLLQNRREERGQRVEGALIAMAPDTGHILAMVGGSGFTFENQFNRAVNARRQVGSAFKPFVFAAAMETLGYTPATRVVDRPLSIQTPSGLWEPGNYGGAYFGEVTLETALHKSLNSVAVQLMQDVGPERVASLVADALDLDREAGEQRFKPFLSAALGVYSFSPLEFLQAYSLFPNRGEKSFPRAVIRVEDQQGRVLIDEERELSKKRILYDLEEKLRVIQPETARTITSMLAGVLEKGGTGYRAIRGTGLAVNASGKTGTTNDYTDAWFVGYTRSLAAAVWIGFDDPAYSLGEGQTGGVAAAPIWVEFMSRALWREG